MCYIKYTLYHLLGFACHLPVLIKFDRWIFENAISGCFGRVFICLHQYLVIYISYFTFDNSLKPKYAFKMFGFLDETQSKIVSNSLRYIYVHVCKIHNH